MSDRFWVMFGPIFGRFGGIVGVHFCAQLFDRSSIGFGMVFLSEVQMFHNAGTLKKLFSFQFLQCFVKVALFTTRTETIDKLLWNLKFDGENTKNSSRIVFFERSESDRVSDPISGPFWDILGGLGIHWLRFWPLGWLPSPQNCRCERCMSDASAPVSGLQATTLPILELRDPLGPRFWTILG